MRRRSFEIAFTPAIQARARKAQARAGCAVFSNRVGWSFDDAALGMDEQDLISARNGFCGLSYHKPARTISSFQRTYLVCADAKPVQNRSAIFTPAVKLRNAPMISCPLDRPRQITRLCPSCETESAHAAAQLRPTTTCGFIPLPCGRSL